MPRVRVKRRVHRMWDIGMMERAVRDVKDGKYTIRHAASYYGVPKTSLYEKVKGKSTIFTRPGPKPRLSAELERELYDLAMEKEQTGMSKSEFLTLAGEFAAEHGKPFNSGRPSLNWYRKFIKRQKELTEIEIQSNIYMEKSSSKSTWSPSKRKSTKPRRKVEVEYESSLDSDSESEEEEEEEMSSLPSSSDSEPEPPKRKRQKKMKKSRSTKKRKKTPKRSPTPKKKPSTPKKMPKLIIRPLVKKETDSSDVDDSDDEILDSDGENMMKAINAIKKGDMTYKKAAQYFNVPKSTLHDHVRKGYNPGAKRGTKPTLSKALEKQLYEVALKREDLGLSKVDFLEMAGELAAENHTPFKNGRPSESWYLKMMNRGNSRNPSLLDDDLSSPSKNTSDHQYSITSKLEEEFDSSPTGKKRSPCKSDAVRRIRSALEEHLTRPSLPVQRNLSKMISLRESEADSGHVVVDSVIDMNVEDTSNDAQTTLNPVYDLVKSRMTNAHNKNAKNLVSIEARGIKAEGDEEKMVPGNQSQDSTETGNVPKENVSVVQVTNGQSDVPGSWRIVQENANVTIQKVKEEPRTLDPAIFTSDEAVQNAVLSLLEVSDRTASEAKMKSLNMVQNETISQPKTVIPFSTILAPNPRPAPVLSQVGTVAAQGGVTGTQSSTVIPLVGTVIVGASPETTSILQVEEQGGVVSVVDNEQADSSRVQVLAVESVPEVKTEVQEVVEVECVPDENVVTEEVVGFVMEDGTYFITDDGLLINAQDIQ